jgi:hypothetical protein
VNNLLDIALLLLLMVLGAGLIYLSTRPSLSRYPIVRIGTLLFGTMLFIGVGWCLGIALGVLRY